MKTNTLDDQFMPGSSIQYINHVISHFGISLAEDSVTKTKKAPFYIKIKAKSNPELTPLS
jgi:hypothetical protein